MWDYRTWKTEIYTDAPALLHCINLLLHNIFLLTHTNTIFRSILEDKTEIMPYLGNTFSTTLIGALATASYILERKILKYDQVLEPS